MLNISKFLEKLFLVTVIFYIFLNLKLCPLMGNEEKEMTMHPMNSHNENLAKLVDAFKLVSVNGKWGSFLICFADNDKNYYIQCSPDPDKLNVFHCEAVSNEFLDAKFQLSEEQIAKLKALGWNSPRSNSSDYPNFYRDWQIVNDNARVEMGQEVLRALNVYGFSFEEKLEVEVNLE